MAGLLMGLQLVGLNVNPGRFLRSVDRAQVGRDTFGDARKRVGRDGDLRRMRVDFDAPTNPDGPRLNGPAFTIDRPNGAPLHTRARVRESTRATPRAAARNRRRAKPRNRFR